VEDRAGAGYAFYESNCSRVLEQRRRRSLPLNLSALKHWLRYEHEKKTFKIYFSLHPFTNRDECACIILLRSENPSSMCAKLRTAAASNNRDHASQSLFAYACRYVQSFTRQHRQSFHVAFSLIIACSRHADLFLFFVHILFVVNHTINATDAATLGPAPLGPRAMVFDI